MYLAPYEMGTLSSVILWLDELDHNGLQFEVIVTDSNNEHVGVIEMNDDGGYGLKINERG